MEGMHLLSRAEDFDGGESFDAILTSEFFLIITIDGTKRHNAYR